MKLHHGANDLVVEKSRKTDITKPNLTCYTCTPLKLKHESRRLSVGVVVSSVISEWCLVPETLSENSEETSSPTTHNDGKAAQLLLQMAHLSCRPPRSPTVYRLHRVQGSDGIRTVNKPPSDQCPTGPRDTEVDCDGIGGGCCER